MNGKFITIEGCEGVGKSTHVRLLKEYCVLNNINAVFTREPGGTDIAERIRQIVLDPQNKEMDGITELFLYEASRREHTLKLIKPAIEEGKIVFCDRYTDSTLAYQAYARGLDKKTVEYFNKIGSADIKIDLTLFLDLDPEKGFSRKGGPDSGDRLEAEGLSFHKKVYEGFKETIKNNSCRFAVIDAQYGKDKTHGFIIDALKKYSII